MAKYHFVPEVLTWCQCFGSEFWQGKNVPKVLAQNFMPKFRAEILSQNFATVPNFSAQNFGLKCFDMKFWHKNMPKFLAEIFSRKGYSGTQMYRPRVPSLLEKL